MLKLVAVVLLVAWCLAFAEASCCTPKQWEGFLGIQNQTAVGHKIVSTMSYAEESYDFHLKKMAVYNKDFRIVQDFGKKVMYFIAGGQCSTTPWPFDMVNCVPENATLMGTYEFGGPGGLMVDMYDLDSFMPGFHGYMELSSASCIPVAQTQISDSYVTAIGFVNVTEGIKDPSVFDVPSPPCPMNTDNIVMPLDLAHPWPVHKPFP